ncbi:hypothetical protein AKJ65_00680 [candidate division MSBL1 archaeon SCGC-AAA259E19]|uniref:Digeranylgeranylglyceryl phosphate synthase n=1 Tax=candidate division MSBL1 archaeon SCGC-AAA259E19 TaxID=1698264 RepID=A0A133UNQ0_9EURY|nr:hypothetical protein AKJ65_00680 [candidate division MSBL1 archaeon SCGC-AAA259E19]
MKLGAILKITRPHNCLLAGIGVLIGSIISVGSINEVPGWEVTFAFIAAALISGAGNTVNDYADREVDSVNNPERPIPAGEISPSEALLTSRILFVFGILSATLIGKISCLLLAGFNSGLLAYYASSLKKKGLIGNLAISYLVGSTFLFGGLAVGGLEIVGILSAMAALSTAGRELIKDIEDIRGDRESGSESFPLKAGRRKAATVGMILTASAIALTPIPYLLGVMGKVYLGVVTISVGTFVAGMLIINRSQDRESAHTASLTYKIGMSLGLFAFLLGSML